MFNMVNKMKIFDQLMPFGLTEQEAEVYIALYKQGQKHRSLLPRTSV